MLENVPNWKKEKAKKNRIKTYASTPNAINTMSSPTASTARAFSNSMRVGTVPAVTSFWASLSDAEAICRILARCLSITSTFLLSVTSAWRALASRTALVLPIEHHTGKYQRVRNIRWDITFVPILEAPLLMIDCLSDVVELGWGAYGRSLASQLRLDPLSEFTSVEEKLPVLL